MLDPLLLLVVPLLTAAAPPPCPRFGACTRLAACWAALRPLLLFIPPSNGPALSSQAACTPRPAQTLGAAAVAGSRRWRRQQCRAPIQCVLAHKLTWRVTDRALGGATDQFQMQSWDPMP